MKVETPQILWNSEGDKNVNAALLSVAVLSSGFGAGGNHGSSSNSGNVHGHGARSSLSSASSSMSLSSGSTTASSSTMLLATAGNSSVINLWAVSSSSMTTTTTTPASSMGGRTTTSGTPSPAANQLSFRCSLGRQDGASNCVRFSPNGTQLAAASEQALVVWSVPNHIAALATNNNNNNISEVSPGVAHFWCHDVTREQDLQFKVAARAGDAFMDVAWSSDSSRIVAGCIDHSVVVCEYSPELEAWRTIYRHDDHSHFVQGVTFDPLNVYIASMSSDRTVRVHGRKKPNPPKKGRKGSLTSSSSSSSVLASTTKANADVTASTAVPPQGTGSTTPTPTTTTTTSHGPATGTSATAAATGPSRKLEMTKSKLIKYHRTTATTAATAAAGIESVVQPPQPAHRHLFQDEATLESFVRRLAFTTDGAYLVAPAAQWWRSRGANDGANDRGDSAQLTATNANATLLFARHKWDEPCRVLTGMQKPSVAVRPCPVLFRLPETTKENATSGGLPYRSVFCVLTWDSVLIYDTFHLHPLAIVSGLHYCNLVDAAWSSDGRTLFVCSTDGYVSILQFDEGELGTVYVPPSRGAGLAVPTAPVAVAASSRVGTGAENVAEGPTGRSVSTTPKSSLLRSPVPTAGPPTLPPCEPGLTSIEAPPCKRVKVSVEGTTTSTHDIAMDQLTIDEPKAKKKRIQPTFIAATN